ncbi:mitogen-activated protein kinase phosphatase 1 [Actinidia rufa]|uniref:Mitogen-activated protein kinase phosphatase 1 n=1 Tax=Actinidia rufa TaxID=165716 RepID=A0A7J0EP00_9ERIC|nr:mitogen-activated protein kinase phosphatase 1 [Actinidia rufa]
MLGEEQEEGQPAGGGGRKTYLRSTSWSDRSPRTPNPRPPSHNKARLCLPPLQPLSISRRSVEEWPRVGSDDLGIWPQAPTPGAKGSVKQLHNLDSEQLEREFQFKRDKLAFFDKECSRIVDQIYLGSEKVAKDREILVKNGITHVLNCVGFVCPEYFKNELVYKTLWLKDSPSEDITSLLYDVFDYFEDVREQGGRVFVHCCQGVSRSASLVIAYLMWRERQTFEDAFKYVKAARAVTNPNMGFACQLLQCQNQTLAAVTSPNSVLRMYHLAPHSPYDPLHLVPKLLNQAGAQGLDSRGAFVIHVASAIYVWIGQNCVSVMADKARAVAFQVIRYEMVLGPVVTIKEGEEPPEFWDALMNGQRFVDGCGEVNTNKDERLSAGNSKLSATNCSGIGQKKVDVYDMDLEIFHRALSGGVVPPFPLSGTEFETSLPARGNGWGKLMISSGLTKDIIVSSKLSCKTTQSNRGSPIDYLESPIDPPSPSSSKSGSPDYLFSPISSHIWIKDTCKEIERCVPLPDPSLSPTPSCSSLDSFSSFIVGNPKLSSKSSSLSPSTSDYSISFTFSPSSSNWSDLSHLSSQTSPSGLESPNPYPANNISQAETACFLCQGTIPSLTKAFSDNQALKEANICLPCKKTTPSIAERRGSNPPPRMMLPTVDEPSKVPRLLVRSWSFSLPILEDEVMRDVEGNQCEEVVFYDLNREQSFLDADMADACNELHSDHENIREFNTFRLPSSDTTSKVAEAEATGRHIRLQLS